MKFCCAAVLCAWSVSTLAWEDLYGHLERVTNMRPVWANLSQRLPRPGAFFAMRRPDQCTFPFEIVILQDSSSAFIDDFEQMKEGQIARMMDELLDSHPNTTFGVTFSSQKTAKTFTREIEGMVQMYSDTVPNGTQENNLGSLLKVAQIKWKDELATRLIIHVTDTPPEISEDITGRGTDALSVADADYPTLEQVRAAIRTRAAYVAHLIFDPDYLNGATAKAWTWFNRFLGQSDDFVNLRAENSSDFWEKLSSMIQKIETLECSELLTAASHAQPEIAARASDQPSNGVGHKTKSLRPKCNERVYHEDGVYVNLGFTPDVFDVNVG